MEASKWKWFVHLSDIHFRKVKGQAYDRYDLDADAVSEARTSSPAEFALALATWQRTEQIVFVKFRTQ
jgi:hypothetical protein